MAISELSIQVLEKFSEDDASQTRIPQQLPKTGADNEAVFHTLRRLFAAKTGKAFGRINLHAEGQSFGPRLKDWYEGKMSFQQLTEKGLADFKEKLDVIPLTTQSYLLWIHDQQGDARTLYIFVLESSVTNVVTNELQIEPIEHLDPQAITFALRIELDPLFASNQPDCATVYLQRNLRKIGEAGCHSFGFATHVDTAKETEVVLSGLERFAESLDPKSAAKLKKKAVEFCSDQEKLGEAVQIEELSIAMDEQNPDKFAHFMREAIPEAPAALRPDSRKLKQLVRFAGRGSGMSLSFSSEAINESIIYDSEKDALIIMEIPKSLKAQLKRYLSPQDEQEQNQDDNAE
ncbi:nucleoid-associated protein [Hahella sp. HN01]|uniref:nucleoid-associated protein n=1 Tax=unclassified Hahella TaxID=2624107 RepID=UPI001C1E90F2|nr:nucleoid-associated protein [Hahella sp. HN01]MBU6950017.1 nucleoid-associated protein [Hahella sp. HN01]